MATNYDRVSKTMELLRNGLKPFAAREMKAVFGENWIQKAAERHRSPEDVDKSLQDSEGGDIKIILEMMWNFWHDVFKKTLGHAERSLVSELREIRNRWAHQEMFSGDDAYRTMDSAERLLTAVSAPEARELAAEKQRLMRERFEQQRRNERKKSKQLSIEGQPSAGLKPWREVITPHTDVASGNYRQAEFTANLSQVYLGEAHPEYNDPREFFRCTYLTEGLSLLLQNAIRRLCTGKGDPVIDLQTNFGGGKTHSMIALWHLFSGQAPSALRGVEELARKEGISKLPPVRRAAILGTALSPSLPQIKPDGTEVRTFWGEIAWQLLGKEGFDMVAGADKTGVNPGSDVLRPLLRKASPCMILIDEWVAYVRQLYEKNDLSGGSFEASMTFAQSLTESADAVPNTLIVVSLPASENEIGGDSGREALERLKRVVSRMGLFWRPASAEESFEIVRRRLFEEISDARLFAVRDAVIDAFCDLYARQPDEFPGKTREGEYRRRMEACYPIHPELFERLYEEWSTLDKFQRTRGVLRLMASVIHSLWETSDTSLMIMPCAVPIHDSMVQSELLSYLEDNWAPVIERDIDGPSSLPLRLDQENPNMGRYSACRRVARTVYMASAPVKTPGRGADDRQIRLGCVQPGENSSIFGDALRRLTDQAMHLYIDKNRYWYSTQPSVLRLAKDRAAALDSEDVLLELESRLVKEQRTPGDFAKVHTCPAGSADVADEYEIRLVILSPRTPYIRNQEDSPAIKAAEEILMNRGNAPRQYRNTLGFLAPDARLLEGLKEAVRNYLAWKSIEEDKGAESLNLDAFQAAQAKTKRDLADKTVIQQIPEVWCHVIAPYQEDPKSDKIEWKIYRPGSSEGPLGQRTSARFRREEIITLTYVGVMLKMELDRIPLWRGNHVEIRQLREDFARYLYLPRLKWSRLLADAISDGTALFTWQSDTFAYADAWDEERQRYAGLRAGESISVSLDSSGMVVKSDIAAAQIAKEKPVPETPPAVKETNTNKETKGKPGKEKKPPAPPPKPKRFYGTCKLDPTRMNRDAGVISDEVIQHLTSLLGGKIDIRLEIHAKVPDGVPENIVRIVSENSRALKFDEFGFEEE
jgi:predicted AAA+ superfamily ATPase